MATNVRLSVCLLEVLGSESRSVRKKEAAGVGGGTEEAKDRVRVRRKEGKCDVGAEFLESSCGHGKA